MCDDAVNAYNTYLENRNLQPQVVYWTGNNCSGHRYPREGESYQADGVTSYKWGDPFWTKNGKVGSLYVPPYADFTATVANGSPVTKLSLYGYASGSENNAAEVKRSAYLATDAATKYADILSPSYPPKEGARLSDILVFTPDSSALPNLFAMCTGNTVSIGNGSGAYYPASSACDEFMKTYCKDPNNLKTQACNCFRDRITLQQLIPDAVLPVRCLGPNCALTGYLTKAMLAQGCDAELCERVTEVYGQDIATAGSSYIYCGSELYNVNVTATATATIPVTVVRDDRFSVTNWILLAVLAVFVGVIVGLIIRFGRARKKNP